MYIFSLALSLISLAVPAAWAAPSPFGAPADDQVRAVESKQPAPVKSGKTIGYRALRNINALPPAPTTRYDFKIDPTQWPPADQKIVSVPAARPTTDRPGRATPNQSKTDQPGTDQSGTGRSAKGRPEAGPDLAAIDKSRPGSGGDKPAAAPVPPSGSAAGEAILKRLKGFGDYACRGEALRRDGSPDANLGLVLRAPGRTLSALALRTAADKRVMWDTSPNNRVWLLVVTKNGKRVNKKDGTVNLVLNSSEEKLDLWVQDNHTLARGKQPLELVLTFIDGRESVINVEDNLKR